MQNYIAEHRQRKVEANAPVADPAAAETLLNDPMTDLIPYDRPEQHEDRLHPHREAARTALRELLK